MGKLADIRKTILLDAPIEKVWRAVATSKGIEAWWMPNTFKPVLDYEFVLKAGQYGDSPCKVTELDPPHRLCFNWGKDWNLAFELREANGQTEFTLIHSGWDSEKKTEFGQPHPLIHSFMDKGWESHVKVDLPRLVDHDE